MDIGDNLSIGPHPSFLPCRRDKMQVVDLRGVKCPTNFVKAMLALEEMEIGEVVEFFLDDGEPINNVPRSLEQAGHKLLDQTNAGDYFRLVVEKGEEAD
jgi:TusA-related sulfurtransferase